MEFDLQLTGLDEAIAALQKIDDAVEQGNILRDALKQAAQPIFDDAVAWCPVYLGPPRPDVVPGRARDSIKMRTSRRNGVVRVAIQTGAGDFKGDTFYASFLEFGHHVGTRGRRGTIFQRADHSLGFAVQFVQPRPFLRPAFDRNKGRAEQIIASAIVAALEKIAPATSVPPAQP